MSLAPPAKEPPLAVAADDAVDGLGAWLRTHRGLALAVGDLVVDAVWETLAGLPRTKRRRSTPSEHALCGLFAAMAADIDEVADGPTGPSERVIDLRHAGEARQAWGRAATRPKLKAALLATVVGHLLRLGGAEGLDQVVTVLRIAALAACPNIEWHPEVRRLAAGEEITSATTTALQRLADRWRTAEPIPA